MATKAKAGSLAPFDPVYGQIDGIMAGEELPGRNEFNPIFKWSRNKCGLRWMSPLEISLYFGYEAGRRTRRAMTVHPDEKARRVQAAKDLIKELRGKNYGSGLVGIAKDFLEGYNEKVLP